MTTRSKRRSLTFACYERRTWNASFCLPFVGFIRVLEDCLYLVQTHSPAFH